jgi:translation initiation factor IF-1
MRLRIPLDRRRGVLHRPALGRQSARVRSVVDARDARSLDVVATSLLDVLYWHAAVNDTVVHVGDVRDIGCAIDDRHVVSFHVLVHMRLSNVSLVAGDVVSLRHVSVDDDHIHPLPISALGRERSPGAMTFAFAPGNP